MTSKTPILVANTFPISLIRRRVVIEPRSTDQMIEVMHNRPWVSVWGHDNTLSHASAILMVDLRPKRPRPALSLNPDNLPELDGLAFYECWVLSPDMEPGYRPSVGEEVAPEKIRGWNVLQLCWQYETGTRTKCQST